MKKFPAFLVLSFTLLFTAGLVSLAQDEKTEEEGKKDEAVLKERQHENLLARISRKISKISMRSRQVYRLQTAVGYVSTIDLPERIADVAAGDQDQFKFEVFPKLVYVKPLTDDPQARTNLTLYTESGNRLAFEITVGVPETADFVLDFRLPQEEAVLVDNVFEKKIQEKTRELESAYQEKEKKLEERVEKVSEEKLKEKIAKEAKTVRLKATSKAGGVQVNLLSLSQIGAKVYLRFSILNYSATPFRVLKVIVGAVSLDKRLFKDRPGGIIEFPGELSLAAVIKPDSYEYGVASFDWRPLGRNEKSFFRILEAGPEGSVQGRMIEIQDFPWLKEAK